jgi:hypothetical protein
VLGLQPTSSRETWNPTASLSLEVATEWTTPQVKRKKIYQYFFVMKKGYSLTQDIFFLGITRTVMHFKDRKG